MKNIPVNVTANRETSILTIQWNDGHSSEYPFAIVRYACPCVECRGGHDQMSDRPDTAVFKIPQEDNQQTRLVSIEAVGGYAISIQWEDGHSAGIYNWDYLRLLCPCPDCQSNFV